MNDLILNNSNRTVLAVCLKESHTLVGYASLTKIDQRNSNATMALLIGDKQHRRQDVELEATVLLLLFAFHELALIRVQREQLQNHSESEKLFEKIGFVHEATLRNKIYRGGRFRDCYISSILREDFDRFIENYEN